MKVLLAAAPIMTLFGLILVARWSAAAAAAASAGFAILVAIGAFGFGASALAGVAAEAAFTAATILWIIYAALALHDHQARSGAIAAMQGAVAGLGREGTPSILLIGWFFALFLEGAAGFGAPVALAAPLLAGLGVPALKALTAVLIGHSVGVSFGAIGTPIIPLAIATGLSPGALAIGIAAVHLGLGWGLAVLTVRAAGAPVIVRATAAAAALFLVPATVIAWLIGPELPTLGGAALGGVAYFLVLKRRAPGGGESGLGRALAPYLLVILLVLTTRLIAPLEQLLARARLSWAFGDGFGGEMLWLGHPGTLMLAALLLAAAPRAEGRRLLRPALAAAARRLPRVALALFFVLFVARLLVHAGMIALLAEAASRLVGTLWPLAAPALGALGTFVTGSATASNILFGDLQRAAAVQSGTAPLIAAVGQGVGAAVGNMIAPHNIVAGAATVGLIGAETGVMRRTAPVCLAYVAAAGLVLLAAQAVL